MGQSYSSSSSLKSRKSNCSNNSNNSHEFSSVVRFAANANCNKEEEDRNTTSAHRAFKRFIQSKSRRSKRRQLLLLQKKENNNSSGNNRVALEMASLFTLSEMDVEGIEKAWPKVENHLLPIGIRMFISILESRCEKMPVCKQKACCNNAESKKTQCCPTQVMLNEELQKFVLLLMGILRRCVKHVSNPSSVTKLLRKCSRRHFRKLNFDLAKLDADPLAKHFCNAVKDIVTSSSLWTAEAEAAYTNLIKMIIAAMQKLATCSGREYDDGDSDEEEEEPEESLSAASEDSMGAGAAKGASLFPSFDRHLVLYGCQTFQDFFELHPHILGHFDQFQDIMVSDKLSVADALKLHATRVLALVDDIVNNAGNPDKIRTMMQEAGRHHSQQGITEEHLNMLGPIVCHTVRPVVFKSGLWSIEVEKSWNHLFDMVAMLMRQGYPKSSSVSPTPSMEQSFPTLTHVIMLRDTWAGIVEHMHELGLAAVVKLFKINYNFKFYTSPKVRYRPVVQQQGKSKEEQEHLSVVFNLIVSMVDQVVASLPTMVRSSSSSASSTFASLSSLRQMDQLREPLDWIGPVFCNTVRPLLLVQGKWSYQVEMSWLLMFRQLVKKQHTTEKLTRRERYT